jgi:hypothetical protein
MGAWCIGGSESSLIHVLQVLLANLGVYKLATTGELRAIIEALELVDIGDAVSYLGEEEMNVVEELQVVDQTAATFADPIAYPSNCDDCNCQKKLA